MNTVLIIVPNFGVCARACFSPPPNLLYSLIQRTRTSEFNSLTVNASKKKKGSRITKIYKLRRQSDWMHPINGRTLVSKARGECPWHFEKRESLSPEAVGSKVGSRRHRAFNVTSRSLGGPKDQSKSFRASTSSTRIILLYFVTRKKIKSKPGAAIK